MLNSSALMSALLLAIFLYNTTDAKCNNLYPKYIIEKIDSLNTLAYSNLRTDPERLKKLTDDALQLSREANYKKGLAIATKNLANYYGIRGEPFELIKETIDQCIALAEESKDNPTLVACLLNQGILYYLNNDYYNSIKYLTDAYMLHKESLDADNLLVFILTNLAKVHVKLQDRKSAHKYFNEIGQITKAIGDESLEFLYLSDFAKFLYAGGKQKEAIQLISDPLEKMLLIEDYASFSKSLYTLLDIYLDEHDNDKVKELLLKYKNNSNIADKFPVFECRMLMYETRYYYALNEISKAKQFAILTDNCLVTNPSKITKNLIDYYQMLLDSYNSSAPNTPYLIEDFINEEKSNTTKEMQLLITYANRNSQLLAREIEIDRLTKDKQNEKLKFISAILLLIVTTFILFGFYYLINKLKGANTKLENNNSELELNKKKLQDYITSNIKLEQFAHFASHDLKSPIRIITNFSELLRKKTTHKLNEQEIEYLDFIISQGKKIHNLTADLLEYSKVNSQIPNLTKVNLSQLIDEILELYKEDLKTKNVAIQKDLLVEEIFADITNLRRALSNLISNAIKFNLSSPPHIKIKSEQSSSLNIITISDNGIGIPDSYKDDIFKPFTQLDPTQFEGTGIGLAIVKAVMDLHGGHISIDNNNPTGSIFKLDFPKSSKLSNVEYN